MRCSLVLKLHDHAMCPTRSIIPIVMSQKGLVFLIAFCLSLHFSGVWIKRSTYEGALLFWGFRQHSLFSLQSGQWKKIGDKRKSFQLSRPVWKLCLFLCFLMFCNCFVLLQFVALGLLTVIVVGKFNYFPSWNQLRTRYL